MMGMIGRVSGNGVMGVGMNEAMINSLKPEIQSEDNSWALTQDKIEEKRRKGRIRSKITRERRKAYILQLEEKVKHLESENFRLQNLLIKYRKENIDNDLRTMIETINFNKRNVSEKIKLLGHRKSDKEEQIKLDKEFEGISIGIQEKFK